MAEATGMGEALLNLAAEGVAEFIGCTVGAVVGGPIGAGLGWIGGKVINLAGQHIVKRWLAWMRPKTRDKQAEAIEQLSAVPTQKARQIAAAAVERVAPQASPELKKLAIEYVAAIPQATRRSLVADRSGGHLSLPPSLPPDSPQTLMQLLPLDAPPYPPGSQLPGTPYRLEELCGMGGFGAVYKATAPALQHLPFAVKFCLDPAMIASLRNEQQLLEQLKKDAGKQGWSDRIVRLYGYDLNHKTPFLVYEYVPDGDLTAWLAARRRQTGGPLSADEAVKVVGQIAAALAFAHERGLVHRDLKPANVLVSGKTLKLSDFGLGGVAAINAVQHSRIGQSSPGQLDAADWISLGRGSGTPLYMSPEQKKGDPADPRHDLFSLGVLWYQLLTGDVAKELHPGWAKELEVKYHTPKRHIELLHRCVGMIEDRPKDARELLLLLRQSSPPRPALKREGGTAAKPQPSPKSVPADRPPKVRQNYTVLAAVVAGFGLFLLLGCIGIGNAFYHGMSSGHAPTTTPPTTLPDPESLRKVIEDMQPADSPELADLKKKILGKWEMSEGPQGVAVEFTSGGSLIVSKKGVQTIGSYEFPQNHFGDSRITLKLSGPNAHTLGDEPDCAVEMASDDEMLLRKTYGNAAAEFADLAGRYKRVK